MNEKFSKCYLCLYFLLMINIAYVSISVPKCNSDTTAYYIYNINYILNVILLIISIYQYSDVSANSFFLLIFSNAQYIFSFASFMCYKTLCLKNDNVNTILYICTCLFCICLCIPLLIYKIYICPETANIKSEII